MPPARPSYASRRLRRTIAAWAADVSGFPASGAQGDARVQWAEQNLPRPTLPYISLRRLNSVSEDPQVMILADVPTLVEVTILTNTPGEAAAVIVNYGPYRYLVQVGDSLTDVRDGLIAELTAGPDALDIQVTGADSFTVAGLAPTLAYPVDAIEGVDVTTQTIADVEVLSVTRTTTVRVESFGLNTPNERALDYADAMIADLGRRQTIQSFADRGVSIIGAKPTVQDTSALSGAERETRAFFDIQVAHWTRHTTEDPATLSIVTVPPFSADPTDPLTAAQAGVSLQRPEVA